MKTKLKLSIACATLLALPAVALGGSRPPDDTSYRAGTNVVTTTSGGRKVDVGVAIYECRNQAAFKLEGIRVSRRGIYSFRGRAKNVAGDAYRLSIRGRFKNDRRARQRTTIKKKRCEATERITLKSED